MKLWPRTLGVQLIFVTAAAVLVSNLAVAAWFGITPLVFVAVSDLPGDSAAQIVYGAVSDLGLLAALLLLGEAIRGRRALDREHRLLEAEQERSEAQQVRACAALRVEDRALMWVLAVRELLREIERRHQRLRKPEPSGEPSRNRAVVRRRAGKGTPRERTTGLDGDVAEP